MEQLRRERAEKIDGAPCSEAEREVSLEEKDKFGIEKSLHSRPRRSTREERQAKKPPKPNAPCPCNSGKKYKKCCAALEVELHNDNARRLALDPQEEDARWTGERPLKPGTLVQWQFSDADIPPGTVGTVYRYDSKGHCVVRWSSKDQHGSDMFAHPHTQLLTVVPGQEHIAIHPGEAPPGEVPPSGSEGSEEVPHSAQPPGAEAGAAARVYPGLLAGTPVWDGDGPVPPWAGAISERVAARIQRETRAKKLQIEANVRAALAARALEAEAEPQAEPQAVDTD